MIVRTARHVHISIFSIDASCPAHYSLANITSTQGVLTRHPTGQVRKEINQAGHSIKKTWQDLHEVLLDYEQKIRSPIR